MDEITDEPNTGGSRKRPYEEMSQPQPRNNSNDNDKKSLRFGDDFQVVSSNHSESHFQAPSLSKEAAQGQTGDGGQSSKEGRQERTEQATKDNDDDDDNDKEKDHDDEQPFDPHKEVDAFDWQDLEARFQRTMKEHDERHSAIHDDFRRTMNVRSQFNLLLLAISPFRPTFCLPFCSSFPPPFLSSPERPCISSETSAFASLFHLNCRTETKINCNENTVDVWHLGTSGSYT